MDFPGTVVNDDQDQFPGEVVGEEDQFPGEVVEEPAPFKPTSSAPWSGYTTDEGPLSLIPTETGKRVVNDAVAFALRGAVGIPGALAGLADIAQPSNPLANLGIGPRFQYGKLLDTAAPGLKRYQGELGQMLSPETQEAQRRFAEAQGFGAKIEAALKNPSVIAGSVLESLPLMFAGGAAGGGLTRGMVGRAAARGPVALARARAVAGALGEGLMGAGGAASQIREASDDKELSGKGAAIAAGSGLLTAVLGYAGGRVSDYFGLDDADTLFAVGRNLVSRGPKDAGLFRNGVMAFRRAIGGMVMEGFEELTQEVQEQILQNKATGRPWYEGVADAAILGTLSGMAMGLGANVSARSGGKSDTKPAAAPTTPPTGPAIQPAAAVEPTGPEAFTDPEPDPELDAAVDAAVERVAKQRQVPTGPVTMGEGGVAVPLDEADAAFNPEPRPIRPPAQTPPVAPGAPGYVLPMAERGGEGISPVQALQQDIEDAQMAAPRRELGVVDQSVADAAEAINAGTVQSQVVDEVLRGVAAGDLGVIDDAAGGPVTQPPTAPTPAIAPPTPAPQVTAVAPTVSPAPAIGAGDEFMARSDPDTDRKAIAEFDKRAASENKANGTRFPLPGEFAARIPSMTDEKLLDTIQLGMVKIRDVAGQEPNSEFDAMYRINLATAYNEAKRRGLLQSELPIVEAYLGKQKSVPVAPPTPTLSPPTPTQPAAALASPVVNPATESARTVAEREAALLKSARAARRKARGKPVAAAPVQTPPAAADAPQSVPKRTDRVFDANGQEYEVWRSRFGVVEAHPVKDGKPVVNRSTSVFFAVTPEAKARYPEYRTDVVMERPAAAAAPQAAPVAPVEPAPAVEPESAEESALDLSLDPLSDAPAPASATPPTFAEYIADMFPGRTEADLSPELLAKHRAAHQSMLSAEAVAVEQAAQPVQSAPAPVAEPKPSPAASEEIKGTRAIAQRITNAENRFVEFAMETAGLTRDQAFAALEKYKEAKAIRIDPVGGEFQFSRGEFAERDVLRKAAGVDTTPAPAASRNAAEQARYDKRYKEAIDVGMSEVAARAAAKGAVLAASMPPPTSIAPAEAALAKTVAARKAKKEPAPRLPLKAAVELTPKQIANAPYKTLVAAAKANKYSDGVSVYAATGVGKPDKAMLSQALQQHRRLYMEAQGRKERAPISRETRKKMSLAAKERMQNAERDYWQGVENNALAIREAQIARAIEAGTLLGDGTEVMRNDTNESDDAVYVVRSVAMPPTDVANKRAATEDIPIVYVVEDAEGRALEIPGSALDPIATIGDFGDFGEDTSRKEGQDERAQRPDEDDRGSQAGEPANVNARLPDGGAGSAQQGSGEADFRLEGVESKPAAAPRPAPEPESTLLDVPESRRQRNPGETDRPQVPQDQLLGPLRESVKAGDLERRQGKMDFGEAQPAARPAPVTDAAIRAEMVDSMRRTYENRIVEQQAIIDNPRTKDRAKAAAKQSIEIAQEEMAKLSPERITDEMVASWKRITNQDDAADTRAQAATDDPLYEQSGEIADAIRRKYEPATAGTEGTAEDRSGSGGRSDVTRLIEAERNLRGAKTANWDSQTKFFSEASLDTNYYSSSTGKRISAIQESQGRRVVFYKGDTRINGAEIGGVLYINTVHDEATIIAASEHESAHTEARHGNKILARIAEMVDDSSDSFANYASIYRNVTGDPTFSDAKIREEIVSDLISGRTRFRGVPISQSFGNRFDEAKKAAVEYHAAPRAQPPPAVTPAQDVRVAELTKTWTPSTDPAAWAAWREQHPAEYAELEKMRADALKAQGYNVGPVWHGTTRQFNRFNPTAKSTTGSMGGQHRLGVFFSTDQQKAQEFSGTWNRGQFDRTGARVVSAYLKLDNPKTMTYATATLAAHGRGARSVQAEAIAQGHDGLRLTHERYDYGNGKWIKEKPDELVVFDPSQIKSAEVAPDSTGRIPPPSSWGDAENADIRFQLGQQQPTATPDTPTPDARTIDPNMTEDVLLEDVSQKNIWKGSAAIKAAMGRSNKAAQAKRAFAENVAERMTAANALIATMRRTTAKGRDMPDTNAVRDARLVALSELLGEEKLAEIARDPDGKPKASAVKRLWDDLQRDSVQLLDMNIASRIRDSKSEIKGLSGQGKQVVNGEVVSDTETDDLAPWESRDKSPKARAERIRDMLDSDEGKAAPWQQRAALVAELEEIIEFDKSFKSGVLKQEAQAQKQRRDKMADEAKNAKQPITEDTTRIPKDRGTLKTLFGDIFRGDFGRIADTFGGENTVGYKVFAEGIRLATRAKYGLKRTIIEGFASNVPDADKIAADSRVIAVKMPNGKTYNLTKGNAMNIMAHLTDPDTMDLLLNETDTARVELKLRDMAGANPVIGEAFLDGTLADRINGLRSIMALLTDADLDTINDAKIRLDRAAPAVNEQSIRLMGTAKIRTRTRPDAIRQATLESVLGRKLPEMAFGHWYRARDTGVGPAEMVGFDEGGRGTASFETDPRMTERVSNKRPIIVNSFYKDFYDQADHLATWGSMPVAWSEAKNALNSNYSVINKETGQQVHRGLRTEIASRWSKKWHNYMGEYLDATVGFRQKQHDPVAWLRRVNSNVAVYILANNPGPIFNNAVGGAMQGAAALQRRYPEIAEKYIKKYMMVPHIAITSRNKPVRDALLNANAYLYERWESGDTLRYYMPMLPKSFDPSSPEAENNGFTRQFRDKHPGWVANYQKLKQRGMKPIAMSEESIGIGIYKAAKEAHPEWTDAQIGDLVEMVIRESQNMSDELNRSPFHRMLERAPLASLFFPFVSQSLATRDLLVNAIGDIKANPTSIQARRSVVAASAAIAMNAVLGEAFRRVVSGLLKGIAGGDDDKEDDRRKRDRDLRSVTNIATEMLQYAVPALSGGIVDDIEAAISAAMGKQGGMNRSSTLIGGVGQKALGGIANIASGLRNDDARKVSVGLVRLMEMPAAIMGLPIGFLMRGATEVARAQGTPSEEIEVREELNAVVNRLPQTATRADVRMAFTVAYRKAKRDGLIDRDVSLSEFRSRARGRLERKYGKPTAARLLDW